jgi:hypothetical protein
VSGMSCQFCSPAPPRWCPVTHAVMLTFIAVTISFI